MCGETGKDGTRPAEYGGWHKNGAHVQTREQMAGMDFLETANAFMEGFLNKLEAYA